MGEAPRVAGVQGRLVQRQVAGVAVKTAAVGADLRQRRDLADVLAAEVAAAGAVAGGAVLAVHHLAARGLRTVEPGRASCRARVCQSGYIWGVAGSLKKKKEN